MLKGIAVNNRQEKDRWLLAAYKLSAEIGLPELVAEVSYYLGISQMERGHYLTAHEHLLRCTVAIKKLVDNVPTQFRAAYLLKPWRRDSRLKLDECTEKMISVFTNVESTQHNSTRNDHFIKNLCEFSLATKACSSQANFIPLLLAAFSVNHC